MNIIKVKINCDKIDKSKLFKGKSGTYLDITLLENKGGTDKYGNDYMAVQDVSKEERLAGVKGAILGNAKILGSSRQASAEPESKEEQSEIGADSVPF